MIEPVGARVLIKPDEVEEVSKGGIVIPHKVKENEQLAQVRGTILKIGPLCWREPVGDGTPWANVGDKVYYARYSGMKVKETDESEELILVNDEDITAVVK